MIFYIDKTIFTVCLKIDKPGLFLIRGLYYIGMVKYASAIFSKT